MKESFVFYASFAEAMEDLTDEQYGKICRIINEYALYQKEPEELKGIEKVVFTLIKPQLDANTKRYEDGCKGGRPKKTTGFENKKPLVLKNEENKKPNENENENDNDNVNENVNGEKISQLPTQNLSHKTYGEYSNVYLTDMQRNEIDTFVMDKKAANDLINELSINIARDKAPVFKEDKPDIHIATLKAYWKFRRKNIRASGEEISNEDLVRSICNG